MSKHSLLLKTPNAPFAILNKWFARRSDPDACARAVSAKCIQGAAELKREKKGLSS